MADTSKFMNLEKLNNKNYVTWKFEMQMALRREDLWKFVEEQLPAELGRTSQWKSGNSKALATIALGCDKSQFGLIRNAVFAKEAWFCLEQHHERRTVMSKVTLLKQVCSKRFAEGADIQIHLQEFDSLFMQCDAST